MEVQSLRFVPEENGQGLFCSPVIDGKEQDATWHRMKISYKSQPGTLLRVDIYVSNQRVFYINGNPIDAERLLADRSLNPETKENIMHRSLSLSVTNGRDILLHSFTGRFFWCVLHTQGAVHTEEVSISFPAQTPLQYLPDVYRLEEGAFADQYLSLLQSLYDDLEEEIDASSVLLDAARCPPPFVGWIAEWFAIDEAELWSTGRLRALIARVPDLYRLRGTVEGIRQLLELYCPAEYFIVEGWNVLKYKDSSQWSALKNLFPPNSRAFWVLAMGNIGETQERALRHLLQKNKPANTTAYLRVIKPRAVLDNDSYLGVNSVLSSVRSARLDGKSALNYATLTAQVSEQR